MNSPAYQSYQELKSGDLVLAAGTYACFDDDQESKTFTVIFAGLVDKQNMYVSTHDFTSGVSKIGGIFEGPLDPFSGAAALFGTLHTSYDYKDDPSHETDAFEWGLLY